MIARTKARSGSQEMVRLADMLPRDSEGKPIWFDENDFVNGKNFPQEPQDSQDTQELNDPQDPHGLIETFNESHCENSAELLRLPLDQYLRQAVSYSCRQKDEQDGKNWQSPMFGFARLCKAHPELTALSSDTAMQAVQRVMYRWQDCPGTSSPWEHFFPDAESGDAACVDFMNSWDAIRHVPFQDLLQIALRLAGDRPLAPIANRGNLYPRFVSLAGWLQNLRGEQSIMLPTRTIGPLLECDQRTISSLRKFAVKDGLLTVVKPHRFRPGGKGEATEFRFAVEQFPLLGDKQ
jgi:hypothetical protein